MELISVIVPVYNAEPYLIRCVDSICRQTYKKLEIILVDDGSPDNCPQMCDKLMLEDPRIKVIHKENGGQGLARNAGLDIATGTYVAFVDSDDWISTTRIENLYQEAKRTQADMVVGAHSAVSSAGQTRVFHTTLKETVYVGKAIVRDILLPMIAPAPEQPLDVIIESGVWMNLYSMELVSKNGLRFISERYSVAEDLQFNVDFLHYASRVSVIDETGYFYFENQASHSRRFDPARIQRTVNFYHTLREKTAKFGIEEMSAERIDRCYLMKVRVVIRLIVISEMPRSQKLRLIRSVLEEDVTKEVLCRYPIEKYIPAMRLLAYMMRAESVMGVYGLMKIRESIGRQKGVAELLKVIGIGK